MIAPGTEAAKVTAEQIAEVAKDAEAFIVAHKISRKDVAKSLGYNSPGVISEFLAGKYLGNNAQLAIDLEAWLVEEEQRRQRPETTQFVWTNVAMTIKATASYCLDYKKIGMVYGRDTSGLGKTMALQAIHQELGPRRSTLVTIEKVDASKTGVIRRLCQALRIGNHGNNRVQFEHIIEKLHGRSHLLLIDEAHNLRFSKGDEPFYVLAGIYNRTKTAQLWCGTADLVAYLTRQQSRTADESLAQVCRRVFPRVDLMEGLRKDGGGGGDLLVTVEQVREMFAKNRLKMTPAAARFLCELANQPDSGSIGLCAQIVEYVTVMGTKLTAIDVPHLKDALKRGLATSNAELLFSKLEDESPARLAKAG